MLGNIESKKEAGQILLIVILVLIIALTVGLSTASRSITNLRLSEEEASSKKALAAAEAGIEQAISSNAEVEGPLCKTGSGTTPEPCNTTYKTTISQVLGTKFLMLGGKPLPKDEGGTIWLSAYALDSEGNEDPARMYLNPWSGQLTLYWGKAVGACGNAALEIIVVGGPKTSPQTTRYAYDPCRTRASQNNFSDPDPAGAAGVITGETLIYKTSAPITVASGILVRVIPLHLDAVVGVEGNSALPSQGFLYSSLGTAGTTKRKINVFKEYPQLPAGFFSHSLFSP